jgi:hypothetical protein
VRQRRNEAAKLPSKDRELPRAGELGLAGLGSVAMEVVLRSGPGRDERDMGNSFAVQDTEGQGLR